MSDIDLYEINELNNIKKTQAEYFNMKYQEFQNVIENKKIKK